MRKVDDGKRKEKKEKINSFLVATNVVVSRPAERRPTGTLVPIVIVCRCCSIVC